jgi:hypothetical protein
MQQRYGIDLAQPGLLERRSWRWLKVRIVGLLDVDSRLSLAVFPPPEAKA